MPARRVHRPSSESKDFTKSRGSAPVSHADVRLLRPKPPEIVVAARAEEPLAVESSSSGRDPNTSAAPSLSDTIAAALERLAGGELRIGVEIVVRIEPYAGGER